MTEDESAAAAEHAAALADLVAALGRARAAGLVLVEPATGKRSVRVRCPTCGSVFVAVAVPQWAVAAGGLDAFVGRHAPHVAPVEDR